MKRKWITPSILAIALLLSFNIANAEDIPAPPHLFRGYVIDESGNILTDIVNISALVNGIYYNTTSLNGKYGYTQLTEQFLVGGTAGDPVVFFIDGVQLDQSVTFIAGGVNLNFENNFNLSLDISPLTISSVSSSSITSSSAIITWNTNKYSNSVVNYGTNIGLGNSKKDNNYHIGHSIILSNLQPDTKYYYEVVSTDYSENSALDDNSGNYYSFNTDEDESGGGNGGAPPGGGSPPGGGAPPTGPLENNPPIANAGDHYYGGVDEIINFDASQSSDSDGYIVNYNWDFGDGNAIDTENVVVSHSYSTAGTYPVILTVTDNGGATNSTTAYAFVTSADMDGDGWSDDAEEYYGTDPTDSDDYPVDSDEDGIPDSWDADDDNDGITDDIEETIGTNSNDTNDTIRIINEYGLFYLLDISGDGKLDSFYNSTTKLVTNLEIKDDNLYLIDIDNDGDSDFVYNSVTDSITPYHETNDQNMQNQDSNLIIYIIIIPITLILIIFIYLKIKRRES